MKSTSFIKAGATGLSAVALVLLGLSAASAEPTAADRPLAAVGSDTTQDVWNGLSNSGPARNVASYNAFGTPGLITPKAGGAELARPAGSGAGVKALSAAHNAGKHTYVDGGTTYTLAESDIDFARSSSSPSVAGTELTFLPFARDAVTVAYKDSAGSTTLNLTSDQVKNIFSCTEGAGVTVIGGKPVVDGITLTPKLPQAASGTRSFFLKAAGISAVDTSCIPAGEQIYAENSGAALVNEGDIIPFSAAQWIAQKNGVMDDTTGAGQKLADINSLKAIDPSSAVPALKPGNLYGSASTAPSSGFGTFARDTYNVVASDVKTSTEHKDVLVRNAVTRQLKTTAGKAIISKYGFMNLSYVGDWDFGKPSGFTN
ncbi:hypothetical protein LVY72_00340 [Arthrobacter sp. I2-34]|uniref:Uncharacterized protein n=1 Tax=Arthrobacter hankyongi TaxID=2904801 RepID=A0ABS9L128_9MICC|nr:hypothetical protein [Arthrobacter hankyongi]MCG2620357.1 hypothetical protein [Arthrobacter hankyongi]